MVRLDNLVQGLLSNDADAIGLLRKKGLIRFVSILGNQDGRGRRNRTLINGFGDRCSTIEPCP